MKIERARECDVKEILGIYDGARAFMRKNGNKKQWTGGYPSEATVRADLDAGCLYVVRDETEEETSPLLGVFYFRVGNDETYERIYEGAWQSDAPYGVIHRIAVSEKSRGRGVAAFVYAHCFALCGNLKIDTHRDNLPMQRSLKKNGFSPCGIIYLESGDERLAYQKVK